MTIQWQLQMRSKPRSRLQTECLFEDVSKVMFEDRAYFVAANLYLGGKVRVADRFFSRVSVRNMRPANQGNLPMNKTV